MWLKKLGWDPNNPEVVEQKNATTFMLKAEGIPVMWVKVCDFDDDLSPEKAEPYAADAEWRGVPLLIVTNGDSFMVYDLT